jgi:hypothetical protein
VTTVDPVRLPAALADLLTAAVTVLGSVLVVKIRSVA